MSYTYNVPKAFLESEEEETDPIALYLEKGVIRRKDNATGKDKNTSQGKSGDKNRNSRNKRRRVVSGDEQGEDINGDDDHGSDDIDDEEDLEPERDIHDRLEGSASPEPRASRAEKDDENTAAPKTKKDKLALFRVHFLGLWNEHFPSSRKLPSSLKEMDDLLKRQGKRLEMPDNITKSWVLKSNSRELKAYEIEYLLLAIQKKELRISTLPTLQSFINPSQVSQTAVVSQGF